jgi:Putative transposase DNA-binding domain
LGCTAKKAAWHSSRPRSFPKANLNIYSTHIVQILHQGSRCRGSDAAEKHGAHVHHINRFFPSTKRGHVCGFINHAITLGDRLWACPCCGTTHQRDRNAAANIYQEGLRPAPTQSRQGASSCERGGCKTRQRAATV